MLGVVALVGRANVGKSTLFNRLGRTKFGMGAIVDATPGTTRDRAYGMCRWGRHRFVVVDTGGLAEAKQNTVQLTAAKAVLDHTLHQSKQAIAEADCVVFVVDGRDGITDEDRWVWRTIRSVVRQRANRAMILAVNKMDTEATELASNAEVSTYMRLGAVERVEDVHLISAVHGRGVDDMVEHIMQHLPASPTHDAADTKSRRPSRRRDTQKIRNNKHGNIVERVNDIVERVTEDDGKDNSEDIRDGTTDQSDWETEAAEAAAAAAVTTGGDDHGVLNDDVTDSGGDAHEKQQLPPTAVAIVGQPNCGKSSLVNCVFGDERCVVSNVAGTTVDPVDVEVTIPDVVSPRREGTEWRKLNDSSFSGSKQRHGDSGAMPASTSASHDSAVDSAADGRSSGRKLVLIDTAGYRRDQLHKRKSQLQGVDRLNRSSLVFTVKAIDRAHVVAMVIDTTVGVRSQDQQLVQHIVDQKKCVVLCLSKWDLKRPEAHRQDYEDALRQQLALAEWAPIVYTSSVSGVGIKSLLHECIRVDQASRQRVTTSKLLRFVKHVQVLHRSPTPIKFMTQARQRPPSFVVFVGNVSKMTDDYAKFLERKLREHFGFHGCPILISFRNKK